MYLTPRRGSPNSRRDRAEQLKRDPDKVAAELEARLRADLRKTGDAGASVQQVCSTSFALRWNEKRQISFPDFLALAWTAANEKAKEIGWIR